MIVRSQPWRAIVSASSENSCHMKGVDRRAVGSAEAEVRGALRISGVGLVVAVITYFSLVVGELVPKQIALSNPEKSLSEWRLP